MACFLLVLTANLFAQQLIKKGSTLNIRVEGVGIAQGLSQGMIHGLAVDQQGYLWIGTKDGLNRYDGSHFHIFRNNPRDPSSIASNYVRSVYIDARGLIWVGTNAAGVELYNPADASFIHFSKNINSLSPTKIQGVSKIIGDANGNVLVWDGSSIYGELFVPDTSKDPFDVQSWKTIAIEKAYLQPENKLAVSSQPGLGFSTDGALLVIKGEDLAFLYRDHTDIIKAPGQHNQTGLRDQRTPNTYTYFQNAKRSLFCYAKNERTLYQWSDDTKSFTAWLVFPETYPEHRYFFIDSKNRVWNYSSYDSLVRVDPEKGVFDEIDFVGLNLQNFDPSDFSIGCEDHQHNLWSTTSGFGMNRISVRNDQFSLYTIQSQDQLGVRYVKPGLGCFLHDHFLESEKNQFMKSQGVEYWDLGNVSLEDKSGQLYSVTHIGQPRTEYNLIRQNPLDLSFESWQLHDCEQHAGEEYFYLMQDHAENLWIGIECIRGNAHLTRYHTISGQQDRFDFPVEVLHSEHAFITDWYVDQHDKFWIGTKQGLFHFDPVTTQWKQYAVDQDRLDGPSNNYILSICPDPTSPEQYLWIGTDGGGLNKMDITAGTFVHFNATKNGLPNDVIYGVLPDAHGKLWMSSNLGICRFDPVNEEVWSFTMEDGLQSNEFNRTMYARLTDGRLYFGGIDGATVFDPEVFYQPSNASPIVINRLKLTNKEVVYTPAPQGEKSHKFQLPQPLENCKQLTFPFKERMITLGFSLLDLTNPKGIKYRYKLENFNPDWIDAGSENEAVFTNLSPGKYTFLVSGRNSMNIWSEPGRLAITILPPWWGTWWFRALVLIAIASGIYGIYRYRLQQAMRLQHLRNRIAADLHDEIGSTLSSISLAGTVIHHKLKTREPDVVNLVDKINYNTQSMMEAMSDIVWAVNTKNDRFDQVLHRMRAFAAEILEPKEVMVHFDVNPNVSQLQLDMQQRKNLYLIFKEVINNAAKYAQCQNVSVALNYANGKLKMEIWDDGIGFDLEPIHLDKAGDEDKSGMGGNGIHNMRQRAMELKGKLEIQSSTDHGTKVILIFPI